MGMLAVILPLIGGIVGGMGAKQQGDYQAQVSRNNSLIAQNNSVLASQMGDIKATNQGQRTAQELGKAKANAGASGIDVNSGSAADTQAAVEAAGLNDAETIRSDAARQSWGYQTQSSNFQAQAGLDEMGGNNAMLSSFIGGASSAASNFAKMGASMGGG